MKTVILDQQEFESGVTEEHLVVTIAGLREANSIEEFMEWAREPIGRLYYDDAPPARLPDPVRFGSLRSYDWFQKKMVEGCNLHVPPDAECMVVQDEWNSIHMVLKTDNHLIDYRWSTTA